MESSRSSCSSMLMGLPSVSTTMDLLSSRERLRLEREGRATARLQRQHDRDRECRRSQQTEVRQHNLLIRRERKGEGAV